MSGKLRTTAVGRRFSRRERTYSPKTRSYVESLDPRNRLAADSRLDAAIAELEAAGIPARDLATQSDDGWLVVERVVHVGGNEPDSRLGLLAQIVHHASAIKAWAKAHPGDEGACERRVLHAYALGRVATLADAYAIDDAQLDSFRRTGADAVRKYSDADRAHWRQLRSTRFAHLSELRAAQLIAKACGLSPTAVSSIRAELGKKAAKPL